MKKVLIALLLSLATLNSQSIDTLKELGKKGDVKALMQLASIYENGKGVKQDIELARRYYLQAKELGNKDAIIALSLIELSNNIQKETHLTNSVNIKTKTTLNYKIEIDDLKDIVSKAKNNDHEALYTLATIYDNGYGKIKANPKKALLLYIKSAKLGNKKAKNVLSLKRNRLKDSLK